MGERAERLANALDPRIYTAKRYRRFVIRTRSSRVDTTHAPGKGAYTRGAMNLRRIFWQIECKRLRRGKERYRGHE